jgi:3'(2'), 5'-bisphosphate nucleotidase
MDGIVIPGFEPGEMARRISAAAAASTGSAELGEDLGLAAFAVVIGGLEAMRFYGSTDLDVKDPTGRGPVTRADRASHEAIVDLLRDRRPEDAVLSEEGDGPAPAGDPSRRWIVDPLDGTQEFMAGIGEFSVMVGLAVEGSAVLGAVYRPDPGRLYAGIADRAAWRVGNGGSPPDLRPMRVGPAAAGLRFARSRSHPDARLQGLVDRIRPDRTILSGSVGTKCALIAEGEADLYVHPVPYLREWDTCAPEAVLRGAGGRVTDCRGEPLAYGKPEPAQPFGIFAARTDIWNRFSSTIFDIGRDL